MIEVVSIGGRVKAAAVGMSHLYPVDNDVVALDKKLRALRDNPPRELLEAFFPSDHKRLRQMMHGIGFYRPILKTDQGMSGNFLPFQIDEKVGSTNLTPMSISREEGIAIPEPWYPHNPDTVHFVQQHFHSLDFDALQGVFEELGQREAGKGRAPFFLIRPAAADREIVVGRDIISRVNCVVGLLMEKIIEEARKLEQNYSGKHQGINLLYCQPDVFVFADGTVVVEKINCPDVGLFLSGLQNPFSTILPAVQKVTRGLQQMICKTIASNICTSDIALITRDEVLTSREDVLEMGEIEALKHGLASLGIRVETYPVSRVQDIRTGSHVLLLNVDYQTAGAHTLLKLHGQEELVCYPNPFFQMACPKASGLADHVIPARYQERFLQLAGSHPKDAKALRDVWQQLNRLLYNNGIESDIIYGDIGEEVVPIFRRSMHSWQQLPKRVVRKETPRVTLRSIPATPRNLILRKDTGPLLHVFRFMCVKTN